MPRTKKPLTPAQQARRDKLQAESDARHAAETAAYQRAHDEQQAAVKEARQNAPYGGGSYGYK